MSSRRFGALHPFSDSIPSNVRELLAVGLLHLLHCWKIWAVHLRFLTGPDYFPTANPKALGVSPDAFFWSGRVISDFPIQTLWGARSGHRIGHRGSGGLGLKTGRGAVKGIEIWRRGWDLNPRARFCQATRFRGGLFQPLRHLSRPKV